MDSVFREELCFIPVETSRMQIANLEIVWFYLTPLYTPRRTNPNPTGTPYLLLSMQEGGSSIIELGILCTDPQADCATIQKTNRSR